MHKVSDMCYQGFLGGFWHIQNSEFTDATNQSPNAEDYWLLKVMHVAAKILLLVAMTVGFINISSFATVSFCAVLSYSFIAFSSISKKIHNNVMNNDKLVQKIMSGDQVFFVAKS